MAAIANSAVSESVMDFDLHGVVGVRLLSASPSDVAGITRQIGAMHTESLEREPDITIRFVRELPLDGLRFVTYQSTGYTDEGFYFLRQGKNPTRARIDFRQIGGPCEIVCQSGLGTVPLLIALVNMTALAKGLVPLHGSAFVQDRIGAIVTGWAKGGKTEALLSFANHGARYVGDEWVLVSEDGDTVYGVPEHMRLWEWHLESMPHLDQLPTRAERWQFRAIHVLDYLSSRAPRSLVRTLPFKAIRQAMPALRRQLHVRVSPRDIFRDATGPFSAALHKVFFMQSHESQEITVEPADPSELAARMASSVQYELLPLMSAYLEFKFAFPDAVNPMLETLSQVHGEMLVRALAGKDAYIVRHPYPVSFAELYQAMVPHMRLKSGIARPAA